jgi:transcriptional regulator with XRE-family HTH domain
MNNQEKRKIQDQLRQFLKQYRIEHRLSAEQTADKLGVEIATYRTLEGIKASNRVLSVLEYLEKIAALNKLTLTSFMGFLERNQRTESGTNNLKRELYDWEKNLLHKFDMLGIPLRNRFMKILTNKDDEEVKENLSFLTHVSSLPMAKRKALFTLVKEMASDA